MKNKVELLAPVGSYEALKAAVENGADAVYLGGKMFNARQYASNFENEELIEAVKYAHTKGVKVYVVLNIMLNQKEIEEVIDYVRFLYEADVDALIVQDLGVSDMIKRVFPDFEIHGSTQMSIHNLQGAKLLKDIGFERVVVARENSVEEIKEIKEASQMDIEVFVHGALCMSYSGQCLMSSMIGGRSGNRGRCAQTCRMKYTLVDTETQKSIEKFDKPLHLLSPKDLNTIDYLNEIIEAGADSLKIEGRMKKAEYVATVVSAYREKLSSGVVNQETKEDLKQIFSRGFTKGFVLNEEMKNYASIDKPNNRGGEIGRVIRAERGYFYVKLEKELKKGDGIELIGGRHEIGMKIEKMFVSKEDVTSAPAGSKVKIKVKDSKNIKTGLKVMKTSSVDLLNKAESSYKNKEDLKKLDIDMKLKVKRNQAVELEVSRGEIKKIVCSENPQEALKVAVTKEKLLKQLAKLGSTAYKLNNCEIELEDGLMVPMSQINAMRREATEGLDEILENRHKRNLNEQDFAKRKENFLKDELYDEPVYRNPKVAVNVYSYEMLKKLNLKKVDRIYLKYTKNLKESIEELQNFDIEIYLVSNRITSSEEVSKFMNVVKNYKESISGVKAENLGVLYEALKLEDLKVSTGAGLNVFNSKTINVLDKMKVDTIELSHELTFEQIEELMDKTDAETEIMVYGRVPLMFLKYCPISGITGCSGENCETCKLNSTCGLKDRMGMVFPIERRDGVTTVYNSRNTVMIEDIYKIKRTGISIYTLDLREEVLLKETQEIFEEAIRRSAKTSDIKEYMDMVKEKIGFTKGHLYRGIE